MRIDVRHTYLCVFVRKRNACVQGPRRSERWFHVDVPVDVAFVEGADAPSVVSWRDPDDGNGTCRLVHGVPHSPLRRPDRYAVDEDWLRDVASAPVEGEDDPFGRYNFRADATPVEEPPPGYEGSTEPRFPTGDDGQPTRPVLVDGRAWVAVDEPFLLATHASGEDGSVDVRARVETYGYGPHRCEGHAFRIDSGDAVEPFFRALFPGRTVRVVRPEVEVHDASALRLALDDRTLVRGADATLAAMRTPAFFDRPGAYMAAYVELRDAVVPVKDAVGDDASKGSPEPGARIRLVRALETALGHHDNAVGKAALVRMKVMEAVAASRAETEAAEEYALSGMAP